MPKNPPNLFRGRSSQVAALLLIGTVAWVYWPVRRAEFVWDDIVCLRDAAALRHGDAWKGLLTHGFCEWSNYFRPLVVAFYALQVRAFDAAPGPMHLVSLGLHLLNTALVGALAFKLLPRKPVSFNMRLPLYFGMAFYGLHPTFVEPVTWIGCHHELLLTFFILSGLLLNELIRHPVRRALAVALCFLGAAYTKESAAVFPLLVLMFDWLRTPRLSPFPGAREALRLLLHKQGTTYLALAATGAAYLASRQWAIGFLIKPAASSVPLFARLQEASFAYLAYWRMLVWPIGSGPEHIVDEHRFASVDPTLLGIDGIAIAIALTGLYGLWKRKPLPALIAFFTAPLLPVLHLIPAAFDQSLYHERYVMTACAIVSAMAPGLLAGRLQPRNASKLAAWGLPTATVAWLVLSVVSIRATIPLWSNELLLWQWALASNPDSTVAKQHLLAYYINQQDFPRARRMADDLMKQDGICGKCLLNIAYLDLAQHDLQGAAATLDRLENGGGLAREPNLLHSYIVTRGVLRELQNDLPGAEEAYRDAIRVDPLDPIAQMDLAELLARMNRNDEARKIAAGALPLFASAEREKRRQQFERMLQPAAPPPLSP